MTDKFQESKKLKEIVEGYGWQLFDATMPEKKQTTITWAEFEKQGPAEEYLIGNNYVFAPIPENGQSLRDAYSVTKGLGPNMQVDNINEDCWAGISVVNGPLYSETKRILFTRIDFLDEIIILFSPPTREMLDSDKLGIYSSHAIETFERYFRIVTPEEYGITGPITIPHRLEDN